MLTRVLSRAVPEVCVESAVLIKTTIGRYWIQVEPDHYEYWERFRQKYPYCAQLARARGVKELDLGYRRCPEFCSKGALIDWLADTLGLSQGERKLLKILFGYKC